MSLPWSRVRGEYQEFDRDGVTFAGDDQNSNTAAGNDPARANS